MDIWFVIAAAKVSCKKMRVCGYLFDFRPRQEGKHRSRKGTPGEMSLGVIGEDEDSATLRVG